jgi:hypothetical protein
VTLEKRPESSDDINEPDEEQDGGPEEEEPDPVPRMGDEDSGLDLRIPGADGHVDGVEASMKERAEAGLQDSLDLRDWRMPSARDYFWYLVVYTVLIALAVHVIYQYRMVWAYVLWGLQHVNP